jgi:AcrR family transcriptional regulator
MSSTRNKQNARTEEDTLLDAARDCVLAVGLRRTTLTDVARRAGVSRMTIYRRWPDMTALVGDLMTREWGAVTDAAVRAATSAAVPSGAVASGDSAARAVASAAVASGDSAAPGPDGAAPDGSARGRFVAAVVAAARTLRHHPMFRRIVELDPEILLPYLVQRRGRSQDQMLAMMTAAIADGSDGSIRRDDPDLLARGVLLTMQGFVLSLPTMTDGVGEDDLDGQLSLLLDRFLAP